MALTWKARMYQRGPRPKRATIGHASSVRVDGAAWWVIPDKAIFGGVRVMKRELQPSLATLARGMIMSHCGGRVTPATGEDIRVAELVESFDRDGESPKVVATSATAAENRRLCKR